MTNHLAGSSSPYLLQHADNPVNWQDWGRSALDEARERDCPVLLSIGYAACHWCHVMAHESFEDPVTAAFMNEHFVPVKVDREERPDLDDVYMEAVQAMTGQGGWPLTVFLDPHGVPFHGGTYFPPRSRPGMPSFMTVMEAVLEAWRDKRDRIREQAPDIRSHLGSLGRIAPPAGGLDPNAPNRLAAEIAGQVDRVNGGFGGAPKFPAAPALDFLLGQGERDAVLLTLDRMAAGGIFDQVGGGFARYAVDAEWRIPHFEKMLSDNALLARSYLRAFQELGETRHRRVAERTLDWALREMRDPAGGFYSSLDADSEGEEGRFYTWTPAELAAALGERAEAAAAVFGVTAAGNFEGSNVLFLPGGQPPDGDAELAAIERDLLAARERRVWPARDEKVLTAWNALTVSALAEAGAVLGRQDYLEAADGCARFLWDEMRDGNGLLLRTWFRGRARLNAYLEDHALLLEGLLDLYQAGFDPDWFARARDLADTMLERFGDPENGGFFTTSHDHEELIARRKDLGDHPVPAGNSSAALGLLRLYALSGEDRYLAAAEGTLRLLMPIAVRQPEGFGHLLQAAALYHAGPTELAVTWDQTAAADGDREGPPPAAAADLMAVARERFRPGLALAAGPAGLNTPPLLAGRGGHNGLPAAWLCRQFACEAPTASPAELREQLSRTGS